MSVTTGDCDSYPGDFVGGDASSPPDTAPSEDEAEEGDLNAGVNGSEESEELEVNVNTNDGGSGLGDCDVVLPVSKLVIQHPEYEDEEPDNLFDGDLDTYYSIHRESTRLTFELEGEREVNGVAIGFFMKDAEEERIQTFDIAIKAEDDDDWTTVQSRQESSGEYNVMQTFPFSARTATYVRFESHGNNFNNWTPLTEFEICGSASEMESNALFGGVEARVNDKIGQLNSALVTCPSAKKLAPVKTRLFGGTGHVAYLFDGNYQTRWSTENTQNDDDLDNDKIQLTLVGDSYLSHIEIAFFDGHLAHQYFSVYVQSASDTEWDSVYEGKMAAMNEGSQSFTIDRDRVTNLYIVGNGNDVGAFTKISELSVYGC